MISLKAYFKLAKPRIIAGNLMTAIAGFCFGSGLSGHFDFGTFAALVIGTIFVIGSAATFNNCLDRRIDAVMARTQGRALVTGAISLKGALVYGTALGIIGFTFLALGTNALTAWIEAAGFIFYVAVYGLFKRYGPVGVLVGSLPGAAPFLAGYAAAVGKLDLAALILFVALAAWQMPHFYAIALYRREEYRAAGIPVLPVSRGAHRTRIEILIYTVIFFIAATLLTVSGYAGYTYLVVVSALSIGWLYCAIRGFVIPAEDTARLDAWGRMMFRYSLLVILVFCLAVAVAPILP